MIKSNHDLICPSLTYTL